MWVKEKYKLHVCKLWLCGGSVDENGNQYLIIDMHIVPDSVLVLTLFINMLSSVLNLLDLEIAGSFILFSDFKGLSQPSFCSFW
ncbi:hypothetical protein ERO13_D05G277866v2 [Gossypium hirsutum]|uniref:Uncharacterized protein n=6 Tax=Gossypium TaxID=3633 RepID=A0A0D2TX19_GOSRA|nr:hypothetical protein ES319_D05G292000v1 [Gossypium barbadense]KAG4148298.1 hypothetical protein ERO13_D05G277866v2 [Gossypium hirsutum]KJB60131.1 hypothetical protein B456_009G291000 [Gossypium raimondii]TYG70366.1 hypothetical protein ES288_D05G307600v1 [Gossypium darwinii]TYH73139.1 hypothetical protein ES332_D05G307700v1 [Gossypium tomentosum]TYI83516.1 hypothetical protein E1A91_D05G298400v1 [Gossypium mustelinum]